MDASIDLMRSSFHSVTSYFDEKENWKRKEEGVGGEEGGRGYRLLRGEFEVVMRLVRVLENGSECKDHTDACLDLCGTMQNLREAIQVWGREFEKDFLEYFSHHNTTLLPIAVHVQSLWTG